MKYIEILAIAILLWLGIEFTKAPGINETLGYFMFGLTAIIATAMAVCDDEEVEK